MDDPDAEAAGASSSAAGSTTTPLFTPPCTSCESYLQGDCSGGQPQRVSPSNLILFHVCKLRTGTKKEKHEACIQLGEYAATSSDLRGQVLAAGGLASLIQAWPDVQLASAKAIAHAILGVDDAWVLLRFSRGILDALRLLLVTSKEAREAKQQKQLLLLQQGEQQQQQQQQVEAEPEPPTAAQTEDEQKVDETSPCHYRHLVARVLAHMIVIIKQEWRQASGDAPPTSERFLAWTTSKTKSSSTITDSLERVVELAMMLAEDDCGRSVNVLPRGGRGGGGVPLPSPTACPPLSAQQQQLQGSNAFLASSLKADPSDHDATILTAFSLAQTAHVEASRVLLVNRGLLPLLEEWLDRKSVV